MLHYKEETKKRGIFRLLAFGKRHAAGLLVLLVVLAGILATVKILTDRKVSSDHNTDEEVGYEDSHTVYLAMYEPLATNVYQSSDEDIVWLNSLVYSSLFRLDDQLKPVEDLVASYTTDPDAGTCSLELRADGKFSDGSNLTADDVAASVRAIQRIGASSPYYNYASKIESVECVDDYHLVLHFLSVSDAALSNLTFPITSAGSYRSDENFSLGTGPYSYQEHVTGQYISLIPNPYFYGKVPDTDLKVLAVKNKAFVPGLMTMDAVTVWMSRDPDADLLASDKNLLCHKITSGEAEYLGFQTQHPILSKSACRLAIAKAIDREEIIKSDYGESAVLSDSLYYPAFLGLPEDHSLDYNTKQALELLNSQGLSDSNGDGFLEDEEGNKINLRLLVRAKPQNRREAAESIARYLERIGLACQVEALEDADFTARFQSGDFDIYLGGFSADPKFDLRFLFAPDNPIHYQNDLLSEQLDHLASCRSAEEEMALFSALKTSLNKEVPYYCLCYKQYALLTVTGFTGEIRACFYDPYRDGNLWTWKKRVPPRKE